MEYRATLKPDTNGTILLSFPDLPWANTFGEDQADALAHGQDALITALEFCIKSRLAVPMPSDGRGPRVALPALLAAKIQLHNELLAQKVNRAELSRRLKVHRPQVDRLIDARHGSKLDQLEAAFQALGRRLEVRVTRTVRPDTTLAAPPANRVTTQATRTR